MARTVHRLTDATIRRLNDPGLYADGDGLYLQISRSGSRSWVFRFSLNGRAREMGLGSLRTVTLSDARELAAEARLKCGRGIDPIDARKALAPPLKSTPAVAVGPTFRTFAEDYIQGRQADWKNSKHAKMWRASLARYAYPVIGDLPVEAIETKHILEILTPIWRTKSETASRVRGRIERILAAASVEGLRTGNPAIFKGHLSEARGLGKKQKTISFASLPYTDLPAFMERLRALEGVTARALEFTILTTSRSCEVRGAQWPEIDASNGTWTVPDVRMKMGRDHVVPLTARMLQILEEMRPLRDLDGKLLFPGVKRGRPLSDMTLLKALTRLLPGVTVHGFRATFKTWAEEETEHTNSVIEAALAHLVGDRVEQSYMRGTWLQKRRALMADWERFCASKPMTSVVAFEGKAMEAANG